MRKFGIAGAVTAVLAILALLIGAALPAPAKHLWVTKGAHLMSACISTDCGPYSAALHWSLAPWGHTTAGYYVSLNGTQQADLPASASSWVIPGGDCGTTVTLGVQQHDSATPTPNTGPMYSTSYTTPSCPAGLASGQSVAFEPAWEGGGTGSYQSTTPWNAVTQVDLFSLGTCNATGVDCPAVTSLSTVLNGINNINVANWVATVHQHNRLALITVGGSTADTGAGANASPNWEIQCNASNAATFASNIESYAISNGFDGVDWDEEQDPGTGSPTFTTAMGTACLSDLRSDLNAVKTKADATPILTGDIDPTTNNAASAYQVPYLDQANMMSYGTLCSSTCTAYNTDLAAMESSAYGSWPASKITVGMDTDPGDAPINVQAANPGDCTNIATWAQTNGLAGVMTWTEFGDENAHAGVPQCENNMASYVVPAFPIHGETNISRSATVYPAGASSITDANYDSYRCTPTCAASLHFTSPPSGNAIVSWYNDDNDFWAQVPFLGDPNYNLPSTYTIDGCAASCTGTPPTTGWTTLKTVTNADFNGGQWVLNLGTGCGGAACPWLRMNVTGEKGSTGNTDAVWHMDVQQCSSTCNDTWMFVGDSITNNSMSHCIGANCANTPGATSNFITQVNASKSSFFPSQIEAGVSFSKACDWTGDTTDCPDGQATAPSMMTTVLSAFPDAHFVTLNLGTNDLNGTGHVWPDTASNVYEAQMTALVKQVIEAGRIPVVPTTPWAGTTCDSSGALTNDNPATAGTPNYWIENTLYAEFPQILHGPDLWTYFNTHQSEINTSNCPHPTTAGQWDYRSLWGTTMLSGVYP